MELAHLASSSKQQQGASNKYRRALSGPQSNRGPRIEKNTTLSGVIFCNFLRNNFFSVRPHVVRNGDLVGFWENLGPGHLKKSQARAENRKTQFAGARGPETEKKVTTLFGMVVRNFLTIYVLTDRTPTGRKTRNTRILGHFGLGGPLALREILGPG